MSNRYVVERVDGWIVRDREGRIVHWSGCDYDTAQEVNDALNDEASRYEPGGDLDDEYWGEIGEEGTW